MDSANVKFFEIPSVCPSCGCKTVIKTDPKSGVDTLWCENPACSAKGVAKWSHFVSRDAMNITSIGESILEDLLDLDIINNKLSSIYTATAEDFFRLCIEIDGYGETKVSNILNAIEKSRHTTLERVVYAMGIPNIGLQTAKQLIKLADSDVDKLLDPSLIDKIYNTNGLGQAVATSWVTFMQSDAAEDFVDLLDILDIAAPVEITGELNGLTFCCTGAVEMFKNRKELQVAIESRGGKFTTSVTGNTSYLITNDTTSGSAKNKAAQKLGIPILTEHEFISKFNITV